MKKDNLPINFQEYADTLFQEKLKELERYTIENYDEIQAGFIAAFVRICEKIAEMQARDEKKEIAYINFSLLRTQIISGKHCYLINAYDDTWYADYIPCEELYDVSWALRYLDEYEEGLRLEAKRYVGKITPIQVQDIKLEKALIFHEYIKQVARKGIQRAVTTSAFQDILRAPRLDIRVGEYFDFSESIYLLDNTPRDSQEVRFFLEKKYPYAYGYQYYEGLDLRGGNYSDSNFTYTAFQSCNLAESSLKNSVLRGTRFSQCDLKGVSFQGAAIMGTDFSKSNLAAANFNGSNGDVYFIVDNLQSPLFERICFKEANLRDAVMDNSNLTGADFTGACLEGASFKNTNLTMALVPKKYRSELGPFTPRQIQQIQWIE